MKNYDETQLESCLARIQDAKEQIEIVKQVLVDFGKEWEDGSSILASAGLQNCEFISIVMDKLQTNIEQDILDIL